MKTMLLLLMPLVVQDDWDARIKDLPETEELWYSYARRDEQLGYFRIKTSKAEDGSLKVYFELRIKRGDKTLKWISTSHLKLDRWLTPISYKANIDGEGEIEANFEKGKVTVNGKEKEVPDRLITTEGELLLVATLPMKEGTKIEYNSWESEDARHKPQHILEVMGKKDVDVDGKKVNCTVVRHSGKGCGEHYYYVDGDRRIVKMVFDSNKVMLLTDEETATGEK